MIARVITTLTLFAGFIPSAMADTVKKQAFLIDKGKIIEVFSFLILILALIIVISMVVKKFRLTSKFTSNLISVVSTIPLTTKDRLVVIKTGSESILLGLSPGRIGYLCHLDASEIENAPGKEPKFFKRFA